ncbi:MAG: ribose 5-phosphate isomerase A [Parachlamydiaceae bacterium]|nr:ribose 5-phosphate isomerase A [Parachlamydiaceae bacterium]
MNLEDQPIVIAKRAAGIAAAQFVQNYMLVGLGTGSTASYFIEALGNRCREEGLKIKTVATSIQSMQHATKLNIPLIDDQSISSLDLTIDGADEIDLNKNMIKGGGGALLREKLLATSSREMIVVVDENKVVDSLGSFPVPVEISSFAYQTTILRLKNKGYSGKIRLNRDHTIFITDNDNYIFDIQFDGAIKNPENEHDKLRQITGVLETGLFYKVATKIIVGYQNGLTKILK